MTNKKLTINPALYSEELKGMVVRNVVAQQLIEVLTATHPSGLWRTMLSYGGQHIHPSIEVYDNQNVKILSSNTPVFMDVSTAADATSVVDGYNPVLVAAADKFGGAGGKIVMKLYGKMPGVIYINTIGDGNLAGLAAHYTIDGAGVYSLTIPFKVENV